VSDLNFDEKRLVGELEQLSDRFRSIFAAAAAERLLPAYSSFAAREPSDGFIDLLRPLERLWSDLEGNPMSEAEIDEAIEDCWKLLAAFEERDWSEGQNAADHAATALCYAFRCRKTGSSQEAAWAARTVYEALDDFVVTRDQIDLNQPGAEQLTLSHPLIQTELSRQRRDLDELLVSDRSTLPEVVAGLRERAKVAAMTFFG
jgi:hypothetical protein